MEKFENTTIKLQKAEIITALVTPFNPDGSINFAAYPELIEHLLAHHTQGLILAGTTAESPTLTHDEELEIFALVNKIVAGRVPLIAGVGTNDTCDSIEFVKEVAALGYIDAGLAVVPYYNKPTQEGLYQHFKAIAEASDLPIILYNIPGRVVVRLTVETVIRLAQLPKIIAVKECTDTDSIARLIEEAPPEFLVYTGEDGLAFHTKALGGSGVVSVVSHLYGDELFEMFADLDSGKLAEAARIQRLLVPKIQALFAQPNPAPIKAALNAKSFAVGGLRLPLVACTEREKADLLEILAK